MAFATTPDQAGEKFKATMKFGEERRTLWLNLNNKDWYGRHRGFVLYGMDVRILSGTSIKVGPGAVYTPWGTRIIIDAYSDDASGYNTLDVATKFAARYPGKGWNTEAGGNTFPHVIAIVAELKLEGVNAGAKKMPSIDSLSEYLASVELKVKQVAYRRESLGFAKDLRARDAVLLGDALTSQNEFATLTDYTAADAVPGGSGSTSTDAVTYVEIVLGYFVVNTVDGNAPTALTSAGVQLVQCSNAFEMIENILGIDPFVGRQGTKLTRDNAGVTAVNQVAGTVPALSGNTVPLQVPRFGTTTPNSESGNDAAASDADSNAWASASWSTYRNPSFLRDGDSFLWAFRRLDFLLRQIVNRTGDQTIVGFAQDGTDATAAGGRKFLQMNQLVNYLSGTSNASTNKNVVTYDTKPDTVNVINRIVRDGLILHDESARAAKAGTSEGDSHRMAISALDYAFGQLLDRVIGYSATRDAWRSGTAVPKPGGGGTKTIIEMIQDTGGDASGRVLKSGDTMTGDLQMSGAAQVLIQAAPSVGAAATNRTFVDAALATEVAARDAAITVAVNAEAVARANADATKAPLASPALTGTPTSPTAAPGTNTTQIATTAFANDAATTAATTVAAGKANIVHTHAVADVTGLQGQLDGKAASSHTHLTSQVTGLDTALADIANNQNRNSCGTRYVSTGLPTGGVDGDVWYQVI